MISNNIMVGNITIACQNAGPYIIIYYASHEFLDELQVGLELIVHNSFLFTKTSDRLIKFLPLACWLGLLSAYWNEVEFSVLENR
jgi:hypothetical protein